MPKLWESTVENHRQAVREAVLDAAWSLVQEHGLRAVTMSSIAATAGIGRATLYKYFPDVEAILHEHHDRQVAHHVAELRSLRDGARTPAVALQDVMTAYARIHHHRGRHAAPEVDALLHADQRTSPVLDQVRTLFDELIAAAAAAGAVRTDVSSRELADYCLGALSAASSAADEAAVRRLVVVTSDGLRS